ncbi:hypothetical protein EYF80_007913 [Liparis tanakae]|uniref:Uncharacterized protein n=1 Tax=Liparis tanakae TaxID=230148 RepID=A0A4Z2IW49_9TELE|nr:hypothetical protein EYF80_007913 [Liparis tanakae]
MQQQRLGVNMREGGTQVSASALPQGQWLSDAYETRQRRSNLVAHHRSLCYRVDSLFYLALPLCTHRVTERMRDGHARRCNEGPCLRASLGSSWCSSAGVWMQRRIKVLDNNIKDGHEPFNWDVHAS